MRNNLENGLLRAGRVSFGSMPARLLAISAALALGACGGRSASNTSGGGDLGGEATTFSPPAGQSGDEAAPAGDGGTSTIGDPAATTGGASPSNAGGEPNVTPTPSRAASGKRFCEVPQECAGLECRAWGNYQHRVCVIECPNRDECSKSEACLTRSGGEPLCFAKCDWPTDCAYAFDCIDWYGDGNYACIPAEWARGG